MPYLDYNQSNGYLLPPYLEELISADHAITAPHVLHIQADCSIW
jgi:hypothetical protein